MKRHMLSWLLLLAATTAVADQRHADIGDLALTSGEVIEDCRVRFRTLGELNADKSNVIVFPTWFRGTTGDLLKYGIIGPGGLADTDRYHVVAIDALANGVSCSPSNTEGDYPAITTSDMVRSQHRLLTEHLGLDHVRAVMGISMGGMQTFVWIGEYPDFRDKAVSLDGSPRLVGVKDDHMVNPTPARLLAPLLKAEYVAIESSCGHVGSSCETDSVKPRVARFLDE